MLPVPRHFPLAEQISQSVCRQITGFITNYTKVRGYTESAPRLSAKALVHGTWEVHMKGLANASSTTRPRLELELRLAIPAIQPVPRRLFFAVDVPEPP